MPDSDQINELNEQLRERLQFLLKDYSQAEIARRTGHSLSNVSRYVSGTRMPASFVAGLVSGLDIDPEWLLTGKGDARRSDISGRAQERATDLIEIVEALSAVQKMRLGSLTAKSHLRVLRDLNDGLARHDRLQQKLNEISQPVFKQMLDDMSNAMKNYDLDRAARIGETALQVSRFCNDFDLNYQFCAQRAGVEFGKGRPEVAAQLMKQQFLLAMLRLDNMRPEDLATLVRYAVTIHGQGREEEALRSLHSARAMLTPEQLEWPEAKWLCFLIGNYRFLAGELREGLVEMQKYVRFVSPISRSTYAGALLTAAMLYNGIMTVEEGIAYGPNIETKAKWILDFCATTENHEGLRAGMDYYDTPDIIPVKGQGLRTEASRIILMAMDGDTKGALKRWAKFEDTLKSIPVVQLHRHVVYTALLRYDRQWKKAMQETIASQEELDALEPGITIGTFWNIRHYRNVVALHEMGKNPPDELLERAWDYLQQLYDNGYAALEPWLRSADTNKT